MASDSRKSHSYPLEMNGSSLVMNTQSTSDQSSGPVPSVTAFVLRLPDHQKELHRFVWQLFDDQLHTDVTIALDDGQYIKAHKLVLSAFSSYFQQVLARISNPYQLPIIVVKDMHYDDLRSLVEFMYRGCITVPNHRLPQLLKCAKQLKIRGLYETNEENSEENYYNNNGYRNVTQTPQTTPSVINRNKYRDRLCWEKKSIVDQKETTAQNNDSNVRKELVADWLNKKSVDMPSPQMPSPSKFVSPVLNPIQQKNALDLTKPPNLSAPNLQHFIQLNTTQPPMHSGFPSHSSHPSLFRAQSIDECQLIRNRKYIDINGINEKLKRAPSSLDGHLDSNNNDLEPDVRKEKKRNLNIFHAAKYRNRKKQQLEELFGEENELQKKNYLAKLQIDKLEKTILSLIWQQTRKCFQSHTAFICPVCGNVQNEVPKLRSHINMLHNDTEALMKFLMLQRSPTIVTTITCNNNSTNIPVVPNSTISVPFRVDSNK